MRIGNKIETQGQIGKQIANLIHAWRHHQVQQTQTCEKRQYPHIPFLVKSVWCDRASLHPAIVATTQWKSAYHHKHQCKIRKPRNQCSCQIVLRRFHYYIRQHMHHHYSDCCISSQSIQRSIPLLNGGVTGILFIFFIYNSKNRILIDFCPLTSSSSDATRHSSSKLGSALAAPSVYGNSWLKPKNVSSAKSFHDYMSAWRTGLWSAMTSNVQQFISNISFLKLKK